MGKRVITTIQLTILLLCLATGLFIFYQFFGPELLFIIKKPEYKEVATQQPSKDNKAVLEDKLIIPKIGVDMKIGTDQRFLDFGGWVQQTDVNSNVPIFIAVHRFGWNGLTPEQKIKQTLYHVDKLTTRDEVIIVWRNQVNHFSVIKRVDGDNNPEVDIGDVVIYTCKYWRSTQRIFVILRRTR